MKPMKETAVPTVQGTEKEFTDIFKTMCYSRSSWQVWADLITAMACSLANVLDKSEPAYSRRETEYADCIKRLGGVEKPAQCFAVITEALSRNPEQDFLGKLYMALELGNHWKGQFFTPYSLCKCMADITIGKDTIEKIDRQEFISVNDPACGAGATLVAAANALKLKGVNYQTSVLFVAQDIDRIVGMMCYIQLSILGCPGYVVVADTITNPVTGNVLIPDRKDGQEFWFTPFYYTQVWSLRRELHMMRTLIGISGRKQTTFYFDFEKGEYTCQNR